MLFKGVIYAAGKSYPYWVELEGRPHRREILAAALAQTGAPLGVEELMRIERIRDWNFNACYTRLVARQAPAADFPENRVIRHDNSVMISGAR